MSKQSSLMSFFTPKGGSATPKTPIATGPPKVEADSSKKTVSTPKSTRAPLKRVNERMKMDEEDSNVVEKEPKRRRVIMSSSSEGESSDSDEYDPSKEKEDDDDEEFEDDSIDDDEETPKKKKSAKKGGRKILEKKNDDDVEEEEEEKGGAESDGELCFDAAMATSFIGSFVMKDDDISEKVKELLDAEVGKFYELYHMDATVAVNCLNLAYMKGNYAHCGFPESAYGRFADQLVQRGYKVARIEQTETPDQLNERNKKEKVKSKVVRRELCRITSVGTRTFDALDSPLDDGKTEDGGEMTIGDTNTAYLLAIKEVIMTRGGARVTTFGVAFIDTSIGRFSVGSFDDDCYFSHLRTLIARHPPVQIVMERNKMSPSTRSVLTSMLPSSVPIESLTPKKEFLEPEKTITMLLDRSRLGGDTSSWPLTLREMLSKDESLPTSTLNDREAWSALGALISYLGRCLIDVDMVTMKQFDRFDPTTVSVKSLSSSTLSTTAWKGRRMVIDGVGLEQLSLIPLDYASEQTSGSLYSILNRCNTPFGGRLLRSWVCAPSCDKEVIEERQKAVEWLMTSDGKKCHSKVEELMENLPDLERLLQKIHCVGLVHRAREHPDSRAVMFEGEKYAKKRMKDLIIALEGFKLCQKIGELCEVWRKGEKRNRLLAAAPFNVKKHIEHFEVKDEKMKRVKERNLLQSIFNVKDAESSGKIIPIEGKDAEYDAAKERVESIKERLDEYCKKIGMKYQCKATLVNSGKDRNLIELPDKVKVPTEFDKKTMKKGFVRYTNADLLSLNCELNEAESDVECLLKDATRKVFADFDERKCSWQNALDAVSTLDVLISLSKYSQSTGVTMCTPQFVYGEEKPVFEVVDSYHPSIIITGLASLSDEGIETSSTTFVPNDITLGGCGPSTLLLTGPNMGGKSTLMRQVAVLTVLAHMGCMVPAKKMRLSPVDRIFTRLGASDRLVAGQSTFFVEMNESAIALRDATKHSLAIFDELGRGTGTLDGQSLAWAIMHQMTKRIGARAVFSTHYHGLCERLDGDKDVLQMHMGCVVEDEDETTEVTKEAVTFLYRLIPGVCPRSFGFNAARLAGIEEHVIRDSWSAAKRIFGDAKALKKLREEAENGANVETLRRLIQAAF
ncbi:msh-6 [Pristionchus pacificus]|nr:msh-6 [Pristionchus pacificus]|eukprot:PDM66360.1 msh-6 [Pristionchus pacificus]